MTTQKRGPGRPRVKPAGAKLRGWWATDAEIGRLERESAAAGLSVQELVRRRALGLYGGDKVVDGSSGERNPKESKAKSGKGR